jgi:hypothetical protein
MLCSAAPPRLDAGRADQARQLILELDLPPKTRRDCLAAIDRDTSASSEWVFVMLSPHQNAAVIAFLGKNARRPFMAAQLWAELLMYLRVDTGEILRSRAELADTLGVSPRDVSRVMTLLEEADAIWRERNGRGVRYFLNPKVGTHLGGAARERAQQKAGPGPLLTLMEGRKPE